MKYRPALLLGLAIGLSAAFLGPLFGQDSLSVDLFPGGKIFPRFTADGMEHTVSLSKVTQNSDWIGTIGAVVPVAQVAGETYTVQAGLAVTTFNGLIKPPGQLTVYTIDYRVDFPLDARFGPLALRVALGHISSHFADDGIELLGQHSVQVIKDYVGAAASYDVPPIGGYLYGRTDYIYHIVPYRDRNWQFQFGGELGNLLVAGFVRPYGAFDVKIKEQVAWGTTQSYQVGLRFYVKQNLPVRLAYTYRTGYDERGQFFDQREDFHIFGVYLDL